MKKQTNQNTRQFVEGLLGQGRYTFTRDEAEKSLHRSREAVFIALYRLVKSGHLVMPRSGFYVIVDPQHRVAGSLPPEWFIHELMSFMKQPYYVGLLSAAMLHGAGHHRPMEFQVAIPKRKIRPISAGSIRFHFYGKGPFECGKTMKIKTPTIPMIVATPETTAWDLVRYFKAAGGFDNVVTVLSELAEKLDADKLLETVEQHGEHFVAQRLGHMLDCIGRKDLAAKILPRVKYAPFRPLDPGVSVQGSRRDDKWHLWINIPLEPES